MKVQALVLDLISLNNCHHIDNPSKLRIRVDVARQVLRILMLGENGLDICMSSTQYDRYYDNLIETLSYHYEDVAVEELRNILNELVVLLTKYKVRKIGRCKKVVCGITPSGYHGKEYKELLCALARCFLDVRNSCLVMCSGRSLNFDDLIVCLRELRYGESCKIINDKGQHDVVVCCLPELPNQLIN